MVEVDFHIRVLLKKWFYRDLPAFRITEISVKKFQRELKGETIVYAFYYKPLNTPCDGKANKIRIYIIKVEYTVPEAFKKCEEVFSQEGLYAVPEGTRVSHAIDLLPGKELPYGPIYHLSELELRVLREYLTENE